MSLRDRLWPAIGVVSLQKLELEAYRRQKQAAEERTQGLTWPEQLALAKRDPEICQQMMDDVSLTSAAYNQLAAIQLGFVR